MRGPKAREPREVAIEAPDREALLVGWLDELLYLHEAQGLAFAGFDVHSVSGDQVSATVRTTPAGERKREGLAIKAATFHRPRGEPAARRSWRGRVYLDV